MKVRPFGTFFDARVHVLYHMRQSKRNYPLGTWGEGHSWIPDPQERQPCCERLMTATGIKRGNVYRHCFTRKHIANLVASRYAQNYYPEYEGKEGENPVYSYSPTGGLALSIHP